MKSVLRRPRLLDLFCGAGGAAMGYHRAGLEVVGVDIKPQPRYPFEFHQADAMKWLRNRGLLSFDAFHASPPCQAHTKAQRIRGRSHPDYIAEIRDLFKADPLPWVIENVPGAPLVDPVELCGAMFGLRTYRHRLFEASFPIEAPDHPEHIASLCKIGRKVNDGEFMHVVGNFSGAALAREIMGTPWMTRNEMREAIPPVYTVYVGRELLRHLLVAA